MIKEFNLVTLVICALLIASCSETNDPLIQNITSDELEVPSVPTEGCKYNEQGCLINGETSGTRCFYLPGKCRKERACEAVSGVEEGIVPSMQEIGQYAVDHANQMVANGYVFAVDHEYCRQLAYDFMVAVYYP